MLGFVIVPRIFEFSGVSGISSSEESNVIEAIFQAKYILVFSKLNQLNPKDCDFWRRFLNLKMFIVLKLEGERHTDFDSRLY